LLLVLAYRVAGSQLQGFIDAATIGEDAANAT